MTAPEARAAGRGAESRALAAAREILDHFVSNVDRLLRALEAHRLPEPKSEHPEDIVAAIIDRHFPAPEPAGFEAWWATQKEEWWDLEPSAQHNAKSSAHTAWRAGAAQAQAVVDAAERLCRIYFEIASEAIGEDAVTAERDKRLPPEPAP